ncbi:MAG: hypothetical protein WKF42_01750 [Solirubrobacteraceae bacterium]
MFAALGRRHVVLRTALAVAGVGVFAACGSGNPAADDAQVGRGLEAIKGIPQDGSTLGDPKAPWTLSVISTPTSFELDGLITQLPALTERFVRSGRLNIQMRTPTRGPYGGNGEERAVAAALLAAGLQDRYWDALVRFVPRYVGGVDGRDLALLLRRAGVPDVERALRDRSSTRIRSALDRADGAAAAADGDQAKDAARQGLVFYMLTLGADEPRFVRFVQKGRSLTDAVALELLRDRR